MPERGIALEFLNEPEAFHGAPPLPGDHEAVEKEEEVSRHAEVPQGPHPPRLHMLDHQDGPEGKGGEKAQDEEAVYDIVRNDMRSMPFHRETIISPAGRGRR
jgi:hypothetical protein